MSIFKRIRRRLGQLHTFSKRVLLLSLHLMLCMYISAMLAYLLAPHSPDYLKTMAFHHTAMEAAPATFAAGTVAALICDLALAAKDKNTGGSK